MNLIIGFVAATCFFSWYAKINSNLILLIICFLIVLGIKNNQLQYRIKALDLLKNRELRVIALIIPIFAFIQNPSLLGNKVLNRIGPDFFGWYGASDFFSKTEKLSNFSTRIQMELSASKQSQIFDIEKYPEKSVFTLNNFNDQIAAEFLLGAQRTGLPALIGTVEKISNLGTVRLMHSLAIATSVITLFIIMNNFKKTAFTTIFFFCFVYLLNANTLSVFMEGGYGQFLATPVVTLIMITTLKEKKDSNDTKIALMLFITFSLATYADLLLIASMYTAVYIFTKLILKKISFKTLIADALLQKKTLIYSILFSLPNLDIISKTLIGRGKGGTSGGWDQGNLPFFSDFIGITSWLSINGIDNPIRGLGKILFVAAISLFLIYTILRSQNTQTKIHGISSFTLYIFLIIYVYKINDLKINNYILWKISAYASFLFLILYLCAISKNNASPLIKLKLHKFMHIMLFILIFTTSISWLSNFKKTSSTIDVSQNKQVEEILQNYDIEVKRFPGSSDLRFLLYGEVGFFKQSRGFGLETSRAHPTKPLARIYFNPKKLKLDNPSQPTTHEADDEKLIYRNTEFEVWVNVDKN